MAVGAAESHLAVSGKNPERAISVGFPIWRSVKLQALSDSGSAYCRLWRTFHWAPPGQRQSGAQQLVSPRRLRNVLAATALVVLAAASVLAYFLTQPAPAPRISNYVQLTHDGQQKSLIGTDGSRIYLNLGEVRAGSFASQGVAEMSVGGGEPRKLSVLPVQNMNAVDLSRDGLRLTGSECGQGAPPKGPLWSVPTSRRLASANLAILWAKRVPGHRIGKWLGLYQPGRLVRSPYGWNRIAQSAEREGRHPECNLVA